METSFVQSNHHNKIVEFTIFLMISFKAPVRNQFTEEIVMPPVCDTMAYPVPSAGPTSVSTGLSANNPSGLGHPSSLFGPATSLGSTAHRLGEHLVFGGGSIPPSTTTTARYCNKYFELNVNKTVDI